MLSIGTGRMAVLRLDIHIETDPKQLLILMKDGGIGQTGVRQCIHRAVQEKLKPEHCIVREFGSDNLIT